VTKGFDARLAVVVCPSVLPFVIRQHCIKTVKPNITQTDNPYIYLVVYSSYQGQLKLITVVVVEVVVVVHFHNSEKLYASFTNHSPYSFTSHPDYYPRTVSS